jgi:superfamily II DNA or RNA helicase
MNPDFPLLYWQYVSVKRLEIVQSLMLCMAVGMGKTLTTLACANQPRAARALIFCPAQLCSQWAIAVINFTDAGAEDVVELSSDVYPPEVPARARWVVAPYVSRRAVDKGRLPEELWHAKLCEAAAKDDNLTFVAFDEVHKLRGSASTLTSPQPYSELCNSVRAREGRVLLLTGTPVERDAAADLDVPLSLAGWWSARVKSELTLCQKNGTRFRKPWMLVFGPKINSSALRARAPVCVEYVPDRALCERYADVLFNRQKGASRAALLQCAEIDVRLSNLPFEKKKKAPLNEREAELVRGVASIRAGLNEDAELELRNRLMEDYVDDLTERIRLNPGGQGKIHAFLRACENELEQGKRVIVFAETKRVLTALHATLGASYQAAQRFLLTGDVEESKRAGIATEFARGDNLKKAMFMTLAFGAVGFDFNCAEAVFLVDTPYSAVTYAQAQARAWRNGGPGREVRVYHFKMAPPADADLRNARLTEWGANPGRPRDHGSVIRAARYATAFSAAKVVGEELLNAGMLADACGWEPIPDGFASDVQKNVLACVRAAWLPPPEPGAGDPMTPTETAVAAAASELLGPDVSVQAKEERDLAFELKTAWSRSEGADAEAERGALGELWRMFRLLEPPCQDLQTKLKAEFHNRGLPELSASVTARKMLVRLVASSPTAGEDKLQAWLQQKGWESVAVERWSTPESKTAWQISNITNSPDAEAGVRPLLRALGRDALGVALDHMRLQFDVTIEQPRSNYPANKTWFTQQVMSLEKPFKDETMRDLQGGASPWLLPGSGGVFCLLRHMQHFRAANPLSDASQRGTQRVLVFRKWDGHHVTARWWWNGGEESDLQVRVTMRRGNMLPASKSGLIQQIKRKLRSLPWLRARRVYGRFQCELVTLRAKEDAEEDGAAEWVIKDSSPGSSSAAAAISRFDDAFLVVHDFCDSLHCRQDEAFSERWDALTASPEDSGYGFPTTRDALDGESDVMAAAAVEATWSVRTSFSEVLQFAKDALAESWEGWVMRGETSEFGTYASQTHGDQKVRMSMDSAVKIRPDQWGPLARLKVAMYHSLHASSVARSGLSWFVTAVAKGAESARQDLWVAVARPEAQGAARDYVRSEQAWDGNTDAVESRGAGIDFEKCYAGDPEPAEACRFGEWQTVLVHCDYRWEHGQKMRFARCRHFTPGEPDAYADLPRLLKQRALENLFWPVHPSDVRVLVPTGLMKAFSTDREPPPDDARLPEPGRGIRPELLNCEGEIEKADVPVWRLHRSLRDVLGRAGSEVRSPQETSSPLAFYKTKHGNRGINWWPKTRWDLVLQDVRAPPDDSRVTFANTVEVAERQLTVKGKNKAETKKVAVKLVRYDWQENQGASGSRGRA